VKQRETETEGQKQGDKQKQKQRGWKLGRAFEYNDGWRRQGLGPQCLVSLRSSGKVKRQEGNCVVLRTEEKTQK